MIVVDSSALVFALFRGGPTGGAARTRLSHDEGDLHAPHLVDLEVISAFRRLVNRGRVPLSRAEVALQDVADLSITRYPHWRLRARIWSLATTCLPTMPRTWPWRRGWAAP